MKSSNRVARPLRDLYRYDVCIATNFAKLTYGLVETDFARSQLRAISSGDYSKIVSASVNPMDYTNADTFSQDYLCAEMMSKYPEWDLGIDRTQVALEKFVASEEQCLETNERLRTLGSRGFAPVTPEAVLFTAAGKIARWLPPFSWNIIEHHCSWGPGATTRLRRSEADAFYKYRGNPHVTHSLAPIASKFIQNVIPWHPDELSVVMGNKVVTVPKNAKTDRVIAIEPDLNMFIQKGIGEVIRRSLQKKGYLRPNAQQTNQSLACIGSKDGSLATIDLSSASDTIAYRLVMDLLPFDWFSALEQCRSHQGALPSGEVLTYQKFSSMGNGYTFELETMIFAALVESIVELHGARDRRVAVYGDDIIVSTDVAEQVVSFLNLFGFRANLKKSFLSGPFRESCGKHYFRGSDVTPFYLKKSVDSIDRYYWLANTVKRFSRYELWGLNKQWLPLHEYVVNHIPAHLRLPIPDGVGDGGLIVDFDEAVPSRLRHGLEGYQYSHVVRQTTKWLPEEHPILTKALSMLDRANNFLGLNGPDASYLSLPKPHVKWRISDKGSVRQWPSYGPWF